MRDYSRFMKPNESYKHLQKHFQRLIEINDQTGERSRAKNKLEKQFVEAWQLAPDRRRLGCKLGEAVRQFTGHDDDGVRGFDHCTYYTGENDQRIVVTQPYGVLASKILHDLTLDDGVCPKVIDATEWAFYFPGKAGCFIVKFPFGFEKAMGSYEKKLRRIEIEKALKAEEPESAYCGVADID